MIRIKQIDSIGPEWLSVLEAQEASEMKKLGDLKIDIVKRSTRVWLLSHNDTPVFFFGIVKGSFMGWGCEMWFMACKDTARLFRRCVPVARRGIRRIIKLYGPAKSTVDAEFIRGRRFVEFFGFEKVAQVTGTDAREYIIYEKRASWQ